MKKKVLAMMLSICMAAGIVMTANASALPAGTTTVSGGDAGYASPDYTVDATVNTPIIEIIVPSTAPQMVINPFKLTFTDENGEEADAQVVTVPQEIINKSNVPVQVDVVDISAVKGDQDSDLLISTSAPTSSTKTKSVFLYLEAQPEGTDGKFAFAPEYDRKVATQYVITGKATTKTNLITLSEGNVTPQKAQYKIGGKVVASPTAAGVKPWNDKDTVKVTYKFNFMPVLPDTGE